MQDSTSKTLTEINQHIKILNDETGELSRHQKEINGSINKINERTAKMKTDIEWLTRIFWIVMTASIGGLITGVLNYVK